MVEMTRQEAEIKLRKYFNINTFYDEQWEAISRILRGERILLIQKTGFGKSLCYQFPAICFEHLTIVFSPLIALMRDQISSLQALGIAAKSIHSGQSVEENKQVIEEAKQGLLKILYIAPERQENSTWRDEIQNLKISMVAIDEAHCISQWGHDFRPSYKRIINLVQQLPKYLPILATTATATKRVEKDIADQMAGELTILRGNLLRDNFKLYVIDIKSNDEKMVWLARHVPRLEGTGIIYTGTINDTEAINRWFEYLQIPSKAYSGRLSSDIRVEIEEGLLNNTWKCVVSTNALGMGIDKPDIRFIIHTQFPQSPVHYYQEIGRAGRDGKPTVIILLYNPEDRDLPEYFIENAKPSEMLYEKVIRSIKSELLGQYELMKKNNMTQSQVRVICADLLEQNIIREVYFEKKKKYEFIPDSEPFDHSFYEKIKAAKRKELDSMMEYAEMKSSRMEYLCKHLGDASDREFTNCDNTKLPKHYYRPNSHLENEFRKFSKADFPILKVETKKTNMINGIAGSYYGVTNVGNLIHKCKYENGGNFPNSLLQLLLKAFDSKFGKMKFDLILYVPPTVSGDLVRNLAERVSDILRIPISHDLVKIRKTSAQKMLHNRHLKKDNVEDAFSLKDSQAVVGKKILLIDDIYGSGATIKEIGKFLTEQGADLIVPIVLAKTVGSDKL